MYLEVTIESQETETHLLSKPEMLLGSGQNCDIFIDDHSVSKRHLKILEEEGKWFVMDQGSTNGTYIDEERLIQGKKTQILPEELVRLVARIFINLAVNSSARVAKLSNIAKPESNTE